MVKICFIIGQLEVGGAEKQLFELVKNIDKKIFDPTVISLNRGDIWAERIRGIGIKLIELDRGKNFELKRFSSILKILMKIKPDIVHTFLFSANSYGRIASILAGVPILIASERNLPGRDGNGFQAFMNRILGWFSHAVICNSQKAADVLIKRYGFNPAKIFTIYNGVESNVTSTIEKRSKKYKVVGTVGRLAPQKNHRLFLDSARALLDSHKNLRFMVIGGGPLRDNLIRYSKLIGIHDKIEFTGERTDVNDFLKKMDIFVLTSSYEGLSNAIMEAMLSGLPVIATDVGGNSELVVNGVTGFLCPENNAEAISEKASVLINDENMAQIMGENGRKKMLSEFSIGKMVLSTQDIYFKLLSRKKIDFNSVP